MKYPKKSFYLGKNRRNSHEIGENTKSSDTPQIDAPKKQKSGVITAKELLTVNF